MMPSQSHRQDINQPLPDGWAFVVLSEILATLESGGRPKGGARNVQKGIPSIGGEHLLKNGGFDFTNIRYIPKEYYLKMTRGRIQRDDVLVVKDGATTGKTSFVSETFPFDTAAVNEHVFILRTYPEHIEPKYLFYWMQSKYGQDCVKRNFQGTAQGGINSTFISNSHIQLAPNSEQKRIVSKIEELFTKLTAGIESLKKARIQLKRYKQSVLKAAFEGKLTEEWRVLRISELEPVSIEKINGSVIASVSKDTKARNLLETWQWLTIGSLAESLKNGIYKQRHFYTEDGIACLRMYNIQDGRVVWKDIKRMRLSKEETMEYLLSEDDILVNRVNSRELVGKSAWIPPNLETCVYESKNIRLRLNKKCANSRFVNYWLLLSSQRYFNRNAQQTVGMASINQQQLGAMPVPVPSVQEQAQIVQEIERNFSVTEALANIAEKNLLACERLRQSILSIAFLGKLVHQDPDDESADKVIQRISEQRRLSALRSQTIIQSDTNTRYEGQ